jgi:hypothetical protein
MLALGNRVKSTVQCSVRNNHRLQYTVQNLYKFIDACHMRKLHSHHATTKPHVEASVKRFVAKTWHGDGPFSVTVCYRIIEFQA